MGVSYFAETTHRQKFVRFGIKQADRLSHMYLIGKTGVGKSTLLETLARGDLVAGRGFALLIGLEMQPVFGVLDLLNLPNHSFYLKLMIHGAPSKPFSGRTISPHP